MPCGHNPTDILTVYRNIVRYKVGQEVGMEQSWDHILEMWTEERRDQYEWIINDEFIINYNENVRYDDSCVDGCFDEASVLHNVFPSDGSMTFEETCQAFVASDQEASGLSKEDAYATKLKDITAFGLPFLPNKYDLYAFSCKKTCNFLQGITCGDMEYSPIYVSYIKIQSTEILNQRI